MRALPRKALIEDRDLFSLAYHWVSNRHLPFSSDNCMRTMHLPARSLHLHRLQHDGKLTLPESGKAPLCLSNLTSELARNLTQLYLLRC
ncbi:hypothetical protein TMatcc_000158 [Talaromyces marneffei ATCC 18224]|uniref:uncharacterized protein n=1 Tax=Talaromyces marneffei TaxID=37727 RepID=UPI0012A88C56|nr:uncharacterized protein EYB26_005242 [Talaromyces marneffei]QGA17571.1 hypothetical protein EYB26_005242 [Talaromyces marneffei]